MVFITLMFQNSVNGQRFRNFRETNKPQKIFDHFAKIIFSNNSLFYSILKTALVSIETGDSISFGTYSTTGKL